MNFHTYSYSRTNLENWGVGVVAVGEGVREDVDDIDILPQLQSSWHAIMKG